MKIFLLTEGGFDIGLGHINRCLSFYSCFKKKAWEVIFVVPHENSLHSILDAYNSVYLDWIVEPKKLLKYINKEDILFIDTLSIEQDIMDYISNNISANIIVIDDWKRRVYHNSIVIDWTANVQNTSKHKSSKDDNILLLGIEYSVLREAFLNKKEFNINPNLEKVLITMGGSDVRNLTSMIVNKIVPCFPEIEFNIIIGQASNYTNKKIFNNVTFYHSVNDNVMHQLMSTNDICISAAGQTLYETVSVGIPTIAIEIIDNQQEDIEGLLNLGGIVDAYKWDDINLLDSIEKKIYKLFDNKIRKKYSDRSLSLNVGNGMSKIINIIESKFNL